MRKLLIMVCVLCLTGFAMGQITGSAHDFSGDAWSGGEICIVCHTPHNADTTVSGSPLWNHEVTATAAFTVYSSITMDAGPLGQPDGDSKLCLSCHDGTVAVDSFGGTTGAVNISTFDNDGTQTAGYANIGTVLSNDHPISFAYQDSIDNGDAELNPTTTTVTGGTIASVMLKGGNVECSSCHDAHNTGNNGNLLIMSNAASALCLTCHKK